jgi:opacity protein-like surface antigen
MPPPAVQPVRVSLAVSCSGKNGDGKRIVVVSPGRAALAVYQPAIPCIAEPCRRARNPIRFSGCRSSDSQYCLVRVTFTGHTAGVLGGGQVGCNLQFGGNWVIGIEGEGSAADIKGTTTQTIVGITGTASAKTDWIASATGRLGYTWDRWLIYGKGGAAWAHNNYTLSIPVFPEHETASDTRTGWTVGGGIEWAFWNNVSAKAEYNYYDFGTSSVTLVGTFAGVPIEVPGVEIRQRISVGKLGVNYRF